jgi:FkbM family methyltransferase
LPTLSKVAQVLRSARFTRAAFQHRVLAGVEHRSILSHPLATIVDIGANRGQFALAARHWAPCARVVSFEPLPGPAAIFRRLFSNDSQVTLHPSAIGPTAETRTIHISARDDSSSLLPISAAQTTFFPGTAEIATTPVPIAPLANFLQPSDIAPPALLKLDVQGFEYDALLGCLSLLPRFQWIYCECSFVELYTGQKLAADVIAFLAENGFHLSGIYNSSYDAAGHCIQSDLLFQNAER